MSYFSLFQSTHPARGATLAQQKQDIMHDVFQSTHPTRGATPPSRPAPPRWRHFNPRTPRGVRRWHSKNKTSCTMYFNPRTPRGVRLHQVAQLRHDGVISIHAPREGCDCRRRPGAGAPRNFNPRTPRGVRRRMPDVPNLASYFNPRTPRGVRRRPVTTRWTGTIFQSTHPARGATWVGAFFVSVPKNFNPRTPRGVRLIRTAVASTIQSISIHAPREGCDSKLYERAESLLGSICLFAQGEEG